MATTTNFGWETPDDTDLVKDGALAMRTLGNAIDASLVDLKGGTTGQVLSKTSNTDMDFTWVTSDDANAIQNAIVDAKGDLIAASAADTPARLAVGNNGETLVADSSTSTGLRYNPTQAAGKNALINGGFDIWQRGTSSTSSGGYFAADRWAQFMPSGTGTFSQVTTNIATGQVYGLKWTSNSAGSAGNIYQPIETLNAIQYAGQTITISGYLHGTVGKQVKIELGTSTSDNVAWNGAYSFTTLTTVTLSATVTRFSTTTTIASNVRSLNVAVASVSTFASTENWTLSGIQFELGSVATAFTRAGGTLAGELAAAQRYYYRTEANSIYQYHGVGAARSSTSASALIKHPVRMRVAPSSVEYANLTFFDLSVTNNITNLVVDYSGTDATGVNATTTGLTANRPGFLLNNNTTAGYIGFSAEL